MQTKPFRIGTRGSPLALAQAYEARDRQLPSLLIAPTTPHGKRVTQHWANNPDLPTLKAVIASGFIYAITPGPGVLAVFGIGAARGRQAGAFH